VVPVLYGQWAYHLVRAEHRAALVFVERMQQHGEEKNDAVALLLGRFYQGVSRCFLGEPEAARVLFEQCHELRDPALRQITSKIVAEDCYSVMLGYWSVILAYLGYFDQARARADEGLLEARRLGHVHTLAFYLLFECVTYSMVNRIQEVSHHIDEMFNLASEHGFPYEAAWATFLRGMWSTAIGQASQGVTLMNQALEQLRVMGTVSSSPFHFTWLAEGFAKLGQPAEGLKKLREAKELIEATDERYHEAEVHRLEGDLLRALGDHLAANQSYSQALAVANRQNAKAIELRAAMSMARLWRDQGKRDEARDLLAPVYGWFTEGFDTCDLKEAKALLDELGENRQQLSF
jgi:predicted ATPase